MSNQWFRSWHGAPTDPKWRLIAKQAEVPTHLVVAFVWALMDRASQSDDRGSFEGVDLEVMADYLDCDCNALKRIVTQCNARNVTCGERFVSWEKRQPKREDEGAAERVRRHREKQRNPDVFGDETQCNAVKRTVTLDKIREDKNISSNEDITREATPLEILSECLSPQTAKDLTVHRTAKKAKLTPRAAQELVKAFTEYGDPEKAAAEMMLRGWTGFKPDWMQKTARAGPLPEIDKNKRGGLARIMANSFGSSDYENETKILDADVRRISVINGGG